MHGYRPARPGYRGRIGGSGASLEALWAGVTRVALQVTRPGEWQLPVIRLDVVARRKIEEESPLALVRRARTINRELTQLYPDAHIELDFSNPLELLVATILSAQCTDKRVNMVTPVLFAKYPTAADYAGADRAEMEAIIVSTGFFRAKTTSIIGMATGGLRAASKARCRGV